MKKVKKVVAAVGKYEKDGETKNRYVTVGTMFKRDDGNFSIKIDTVPAGNEWNGWLSLFDFDEEKSGKTVSAAEFKGGKKDAHELDDTIPF